MNTPRTKLPALFCTLLCACGAVGEFPEDDDVGATAQPLTASNGQTQNGQTQNGQTQNGTTYGVAGADLRTARKLRTAPAPGTDPDLSAPTDPVADLYLSGTRLRAERLSGAAFVNTLINATLSDGGSGTIWIKAVHPPAAGADPDLWHYTIRVHHRDLSQTGGWLCRIAGIGCPMRWDPACGYVLRSRIEVKATALSGQWNYDRGYAGAGVAAVVVPLAGEGRGLDLDAGAQHVAAGRVPAHGAADASDAAEPAAGLAEVAVVDADRVVPQVRVRPRRRRVHGLDPDRAAAAIAQGGVDEGVDEGGAGQALGAQPRAGEVQVRHRVRGGAQVRVRARRRRRAQLAGRAQVRAGDAVGRAVLGLPVLGLPVLGLPVRRRERLRRGADVVIFGKLSDGAAGAEEGAEEGRELRARRVHDRPLLQAMCPCGRRPAPAVEQRLRDLTQSLRSPGHASVAHPIRPAADRRTGARRSSASASAA